MIPNCFICGLPLGESESARTPPRHDSCTSCHYCGKQVSIDICRRQADNEERVNPTRDYKLLVYHQPCEDSHFELKRANTEITITQGHLDYINKFLGMVGYHSDGVSITPVFDIESYSVETITQSVDIATRNLLTLKSPAEMFLLMKCMQSSAVSASMICHQDPKIRDKKLEISKRDRDKYNEVLKERENIGKSEQKVAADRHERAVKKVTREEERANPRLKDRRKAIDSMMAITGMSKEACEAILTRKDLGVQ